MELWNVKNLNAPPIYRFKSPHAKDVDVRFLQTTLKKAVEFFSNQKHLHAEGALLSRTIYRFKMKFRSSKDFKIMEKLSRALRAYLQLQITRSLRTLLESVPQKYKVNETYLPTKHMLDFILVRLQSLGKLLLRIIETSKILCQSIQQRLRLGHFWKLAVIVYAIASRIYLISRSMIKYTCELYSDLLPLSLKLSNMGKQWLPNNYVLPNNLSQWLELDWIDMDRSVVEIVDDEPDISYYNLIDDSDDDIEFYDEYILIRDDEDLLSKVRRHKFKVESSKELDEIHNKTLTGFSDNVDVGEDVNLTNSEIFKKANKGEKRKRKNEKSTTFKRKGKNKKSA